MLQKIKIINFKSIENMDLYFEKKTNIVGKNGAGKTNILQAITYLFQHNVSHLGSEELLRKDQQTLFLQGEFIGPHHIPYELSFSYDKENNKKLILLNGKKVTKKVLSEHILKTSYFSPISMNLFYLGPKYRRDFLDDILKTIFPEYDGLCKDYEKIVKNRNKLLKNIGEGKSSRGEILFWNQQFITLAKKIYELRLPLNEFFAQHIPHTQHIFQNKVKTIDYHYITKVDLSNIETSIQSYLDTNFERDIILGKTHIGPHIDDFEIIVDGRNLVDFASRGEIKSIIIFLKSIEIQYIQQQTKQSPLILIDDLSSELDEEHIEIILKELQDLQIIFTSILALKKDNSHLINI